MNAQEAGQPIHLLLKPSWVLQFLLPLSVSGLHNYVLNILVWFHKVQNIWLTKTLSNRFHQQQGLLLLTASQVPVLLV